jgi:predicted Zn-dependent protease
VERVPAEWERELGETTMDEIQRQFVFSTNKHLKVVLEQSVKPLTTALPKGKIPYQFYVLEMEMPNAFALPGGHVVMTSGLIYLLEEKPEEIAGVVAHEIAHQTQRHLWRKVISSVGPYVLFTMFTGDGPLRLLSDSYHEFAAQSFSQEYELEADSVGWDYLVTAHIDPRGLASSLTKLKGFYGKYPEFNNGVAALSSHPAVDKRIRRLQSKWTKLKDKEQFHTFDLTEGIKP